MFELDQFTKEVKFFQQVFFLFIRLELKILLKEKKYLTILTDSY